MKSLMRIFKRPLNRIDSIIYIERRVSDASPLFTDYRIRLKAAVEVLEQATVANFDII